MITLDNLLIILGLNHLLNNSVFRTIVTRAITRQTTDTSGFEPCTKQQSFKDYSHPDDHTRQTTDTPGFEPFTIEYFAFHSGGVVSK